MATTAGDIIDGAIQKLLVFDLGRSDIGNDDPEMIAFLNRTIQSWYLDASRAVMRADDRNDFFETETEKTLAGAPASVAITAFCWMPRIENASGDRVHITTKSDIRLGRGELPPAVFIQGVTMTSAGRTGDPVVDDVLTLCYTAVPGTMTTRAHFVGATAIADAATTKWPPHVGDEPLMLSLAYYLALKSGDVPGDELQRLQADRDLAFAKFVSFVRGVH